MTKINQILSKWTPGDVHTLRWFEKNGIQQRTAYGYAKSGALTRIGDGVFSRRGDSLSWAGAIRAMQEELSFDGHIGSRTALALLGSAHQIAFKENVELITFSRSNLPKWVIANDWGLKLTLRRSSLFKEKLSYDALEIAGIKVLISPRELAILEYIDQLDLKNSFESLENHMQGLITLRSQKVQKLLEKCRSVKVKRVFLYLSESLQLPFFKKLDLKKINLGSGKRLIVKNGVFNTKYQITVPKPKEENPF